MGSSEALCSTMNIVYTVRYQSSIPYSGTILCFILASAHTLCLYPLSFQEDSRHVNVSRSQVLPNPLTKSVYSIRAGDTPIQIVKNPAISEVSGNTATRA